MHDAAVTILLVEDNPGDVYLVRMALDQTGMEFLIVECPDGEQALKYLGGLETDLNTVCPALMILDLNLPRFDGKLVLERLKTISRCSATRTIVLSSSEYPGDKEDVGRLGADGYFHKAPDLESFMLLGDLVKKIVQQGRSAANN